MRKRIEAIPRTIKCPQLVVRIDGHTFEEKKFIKGLYFSPCKNCDGKMYFYWQKGYYYIKCEKCGYLYDTGRKMTAKEKKNMLKEPKINPDLVIHREPEMIKENKDMPENYPVKVYCKNCKHCKIYAECSMFSKRYKDIMGDSYMSCVENCFLVNRTFDCKYYKRKWWKFWIKEKKRKLPS